MLESIELENIGPSPRLSLGFGSRLNLLTGDNGLGKTFVLDAAWWALTRTWAEGRMLVPSPGAEASPVIRHQVRGVTGSGSPSECVFDFQNYDWKVPQGRPPIPGLVVYARIDGGFSIWDPARNYWKSAGAPNQDGQSRPPAYHFNREQIWSGLWRTPKDENEKNRDSLVCRGLLDDVVSWQMDPDEAESLRVFKSVLHELSPSAEEPLVLGHPREQYGREGKVPTLRVAYQEEPVPLAQASAGMRRVISLAYALAWAWTSHRKALRLAKGMTTEARQIVVLFDEIEAHLHPRWQRRILPALLRAVPGAVVGPGTNLPLQFIATTHAPLVLASIEPHFDEERDKLFHFTLNERGKVELEPMRWAIQGDARNWLVSETFGLSQARSLEAEQAIEAAEAWMAGRLEDVPPNLRAESAIDEKLRRLLSDNDAFKPRWSRYQFMRTHAGMGE